MKLRNKRTLTLRQTKISTGISAPTTFCTQAVIVALGEGAFCARYYFCLTLPQFLLAAR